MASNEFIERTKASIREHQFTTLLAKPQPGRRGLPQDSALETIEKVFADLGRTHEIDSLEAAIKRAGAQPQREKIEIEIPKERYAEIHCVAVCISAAGRILAARRPATKRRYPSCLEFGCGQLRLDESFGDCLRRAYRDDFGVNLTLPERPIPIDDHALATSPADGLLHL